MGYDQRHIRLAVDRPLTADEMSDVKIALANIMSGTSYFFAGNDDVSDEIVRFLATNEIMTNLEEVAPEPVE